MSNKLIAVWGSSGSGKSLVSCAVANALTTKNHNVIVISADKSTPMLNVYLPFLDCKKENSVAQFLSSVVIESGFKTRLHIHEKNGNLGFMALSTGENGLTHQAPWSMSSIDQLVNLLFEKEYADYIVFDCTGDVLTDNLTLYALENADVTLRVISPDSRGISFLNSQIPILSGGNFHLERHILILNNCYTYSPASQISLDYGFDIIIPHCKDAYTKYTSGLPIGGLYNHDGVIFEKAIQKIKEGIVDDGE